MKQHNILVAPAAFKGTISSIEASDALCDTLSSFPDIIYKAIPLSDGGHSFVECMKFLLLKKGGKDNKNEAYEKEGDGEKKAAGDVFLHEFEARAPWGEMVKVYALILRRTTGEISIRLNSFLNISEEDYPVGIIEQAMCSGWHLIGERRRDVLYFDTKGVADMLLECKNAGCKTIVLGIGGSASSDLGLGLLVAAGARIFNKSTSGQSCHLQKISYLSSAPAPAAATSSSSSSSSSSLSFLSLPSGDIIPPSYGPWIWHKFKEELKIDITPAREAFRGIRLFGACDVENVLLGR
ncbi:MAG: glycerate kinase, partial [Thermoplasmata archaeon]